MSNFERPKHRWEPVGFDCSDFTQNIWRCPYCGTHKSIGPSGNGRTNEGTITEYTDEDGGILQPVEVTAVPPCIPKDMPKKDRPIIEATDG